MRKILLSTALAAVAAGAFAEPTTIVPGYFYPASVQSTLR